MKYRILIALTVLAAVTFSGCKKEGVYEPEARISYRFDEEYTQWLAWLNGGLDTTRQDIRRHLAEAYRWNGDLLTAIAFYDTTRHTDALEYSLTFTYEKKQVQKAVDARNGNYSLYIYDEDKGKYLQKIETYNLADDSPVATLTIGRAGEKDPHYTRLEYKYYPQGGGKIAAAAEGYTLAVDLEWGGDENVTAATYTYTADDGKTLVQHLAFAYDDKVNPLHRCAQQLLAPRDTQYGRRLLHKWQDIASLSKHNVTKAVCDFTEEYYAISGDLATRDIHYEWNYNYTYTSGDVQAPMRVTGTWVENEYAADGRLTYQELHQRTSDYQYLPED